MYDKCKNRPTVMCKYKNRFIFGTFEKFTCLHSFSNNKHVTIETTYRPRAYSLVMLDVYMLKYWDFWQFLLFFILRKAIEMLPDLNEAFDMDPLLKRTFLLLCPVEVYGDFLRSTERFSCLELCVSMRKLLSETKISSSYTREFVSIWKCILIL